MIQNITKFGQGKNFAECESLIKKNLKNVGFDETVLVESKDWKSDSGKRFILKKD